MKQMLFTEPMRRHVPVGALLAREDYATNACDVRLYSVSPDYRNEWRRLQLHCQQAACHVRGDVRDW